MKWTWSSEKTIFSTAEQAHDLINEILEKLRSDDWPETELFAIHLALEEAIMNAIKHGNARDESKEVHVITKVSPKSFFINVTDEGEGFVLAEVPDPTAEENLEKPSGRGIMLMESYMTKIQYNDQGNSVTMEKTL